MTCLRSWGALCCWVPKQTIFIRQGQIVDEVTQAKFKFLTYLFQGYSLTLHNHSTRVWMSDLHIRAAFWVSQVNVWYWYICFKALFINRAHIHMNVRVSMLLGICCMLLGTRCLDPWELRTHACCKLLTYEIGVCPTHDSEVNTSWCSSHIVILSTPQVVAKDQEWYKYFCRVVSAWLGSLVWEATPSNFLMLPLLQTWNNIWGAH